MSDPDTQRIDKWLWFARFARTRMLAQKLVRTGQIRVNRLKSDSVSKLVRVGDALTISDPRGIRVVKVAAIATRRGPASEARDLYEEVAFSKLAPPGSGGRERGWFPRPESRDRRILRRLKEEGS
jgi:ribosome-associated heat shock protein Hsp15